MKGTLEADKRKPMEQKGFKMAGTVNGKSSYILDMKSGQWKKTSIDYILGVSAIKNINGVDTEWGFREEVKLELQFSK